MMVVVSGGMVAGSLVAASPASTAAVSAAANLACATQVVATWPLAQVANETITVPVNALDIGAMAPAARAGYGGLILFGTTAPATLGPIVSTLQRERPSHSSMLVMTDEEGGGVMRLTNDVSAFPWAQTMGKLDSPAQIAAIGRRVGTQLSAVGVNTDLAPVLDVDARAIYPGEADPDGFRSFSGVPATAAADGTAFMHGLATASVTSVVKHFPGLGYSTGNTDYGPAATLPWPKLQSTGLVPFKTAIAAGATAVMLSNARVPGLTPLPASISATVVHVLRSTLGFNGLIVTDSLTAGALSALHLSAVAASVAAIEAGADLVLYGWTGSVRASLATAAQISSALVAAVSSGALSRTTLDDAAAQVLAARNVVTCPGPT